MQIVTLTTRYEPAEDRLQILAVDAAGKQANLWLTRRLTRRLVPELLDGVQQQIAGCADATADRIVAANVYAQLQARISKKEVPAVCLAADVPQWLITRIVIQGRGQGVRRLVFHGNNDFSASLTLNLAEQRQWLEALKRACIKAQWHLDAWPKWMSDAGSS